MKISDLLIGTMTLNSSKLLLMKIFNRMALGFVSSLLLAAGFSRAAQSLDPLTRSAGNLTGDCDMAPSSACCTMPCMYQVESV